MEHKYDWSRLEEIAPPQKWIAMYEHYQQLLLQEDLAGWWQGEFNMANTERNELKEQLNKSP